MSFGEGAEQAGSAVGNMLQKLSNAKQLGLPAQKVLHSIGLTATALPKMIAENPQQVEKYKGGNDRLFGFFVGIPDLSHIPRQGPARDMRSIG